MQQEQQYLERVQTAQAVSRLRHCPSRHEQRPTDEFVWLWRMTIQTSYNRVTRLYTVAAFSNSYVPSYDVGYVVMKPHSGEQLLQRGGHKHARH